MGVGSMFRVFIIPVIWENLMMMNFEEKAGTFLEPWLKSFGRAD